MRFFLAFIKKVAKREESSVNLRSTFHPSQQDDEEWLWREN
jgi:hypothetical protein